MVGTRLRERGGKNRQKYGYVICAQSLTQKGTDFWAPSTTTQKKSCADSSIHFKYFAFNTDAIEYLFVELKFLEMD